MNPTGSNSQDSLSSTNNSKPKLGFYTLTCCEGCSFSVLFIDKIMSLLERFDIMHFNLLKEKNIDSEIDLAFVEGTVTTTTDSDCDDCQ